MLYLIIMLLMILEITILIAIACIMYVMYLLKTNEKSKEEKKTKKRTHIAIKTSNYDNSFGKRGYELYKNQNGLYEPQKPSKGIELKKKED